MTDPKEIKESGDDNDDDPNSTKPSTKSGVEASATATESSSDASSTAPKSPDMALAQRWHRLRTMNVVTSANDDAATTTTMDASIATASAAKEAAELLQEIAQTLQNPSLYTAVLQSLPHTLVSSMKDTVLLLSESDLEEMTQRNTQEYAVLEKALAEATESAGDMEIWDAHMALAQFAGTRCTLAQALQRYDDTLEALPKLVSGKTLDIRLECARLCSFYSDIRGTDTHLALAAKLLASNDTGGSDWDRRNRLKVHQALQCLLHRDFEKAAPLFESGIATFTCTDMCSYADFVQYAVLTNLLHVPRPVLYNKILKSPELTVVAVNDPGVALVLQFAHALYDCDYALYVQLLLQVESRILVQDRFLFPHRRYWLRELHIYSYKQFLDAYASVTLTAMADAFAVSPAFIDTYASQYIAENRISAKIDKFHGVIVTNRPDVKNAHYRDLIQKGDLLLNRIQKLSRIVDL